jgi:DNA-binding NarL/FixJ family response regulator
MTTPAPISVLLVDDHPVVRTGYRRLLDASGDIQVVAEADDADDGYQAWVRLQPAVTVTDLSLPGPSGLELIRRIRVRDGDARILVFSVHSSEATVERALALGACGFVSKRSEPAVLRAAVRHAAAGDRPYLSEDLQRGGATADRASVTAVLTPREFEVFRLLALGHSAAECARLLHLSEKTIANYQTQVKEKLGVATSAALVHLALRLGLIDPAEARRP